MGYRAAAKKTLYVPSAGIVKGGRLDGWRFKFLHFAVQPGQGLTVVARCCAPKWPFPCDIPLRHEHFMQLRPIVGDRAKRIPAEPLIEAAYQLAGKPLPGWWPLQKTTTLRACVKRTAPTKVWPHPGPIELIESDSEGGEPA